MNTKTSLFALLLCLTAMACTYTLKIKDGRTAHDRKQYAVAIPMLEREIPKAKTRREKGQLAYLLGDALVRTGQHQRALQWFKLAAENNYGADALKAQALTLKQLEQYAAARDAFKELGVEIGSSFEYRKDIVACNIAEGWLKEAAGNGWSIATTDFNSPQNDFAPVRYPDGRLVFSSDRSMASGKENYRWTNNKFMDLFIVEPDAASPQIFDNQINTSGNEAGVCFNASVTEIFFSRAVSAYKGDDAWCKIYTARRDDANAPWSDAVPLPFQKEKINYVHPALSSDGQTLYFACNDADGWGGYDIWSVRRNPATESGWDEPQPLSRSINTTSNELFPSFDGDTLYFASEGHTGMGGLDIFKSYRPDKKAWTPPLNLKPPVNSGADDFGILFEPASPAAKTAKNPGDLLRRGYLSSNRPGGKGGDDIWRFEQRIAPPKSPKTDTTSGKPVVYKMILEGYVLEKIFAENNNPNARVLGRKPLNGAKVVIETGGKKQTVTVKEDGLFKLELAENTDYQFTASMTEYLSNGTRFSTKGIAKDPSNPTQVFEVEIVLDRIFRNKEIVLENIYYDYDKWDIRPDAEPTLNELAAVLLQNPTISIQLGSHTDCRGNEGYNQTLSQRRAESAVNYLISKGIASERLTAVGYGESQPAASCACSKCSESEHQTNRRTTFTIMQ